MQLVIGQLPGSRGGFSNRRPEGGLGNVTGQDACAARHHVTDRNTAGSPEVFQPEMQPTEAHAG